MSPALLKSSIKSFIVGLFTFLIVACSGDGSLSDGSSTDDSGSGDSNEYELSVNYVSSDGSTISSIDFGEVWTLTATLSLDGEAVEDATINFANSNSAFVNLSSTQAVTDSSGQAQVTVTGASQAGAGSITVSTTVGSVSTVVIDYTSVGDQVANNNHKAFLVPSDTPTASFSSITDSTLTTISSAEPGRVVVQLNDDSGNPIERDIVYIELEERASDLANLSVDNGGVATDSNGFATLTLEATNSSGAGVLNVVYDDEIIKKIVFESAGDGDQEVSKTIGSIELLSDSFQMASSGAQIVNLVSLVKDENNNLMDGVSVSFRSTSGGIAVTQAVTGADGKAVATLNTTNAPQTRDITVDAFVGDKVATVKILVTGTTIKINGNDSIVTGNEADMTVEVLDSDGNGIAQKRVYLTSLQGNALLNKDGQALPTDSANSNKAYIDTGTTGGAQFKYDASVSGTDTITAGALGETTSFNISVSPDTFVINELKVDSEVVTSAEVPMSQGGTFKLVWQKDGVPFEGDVLFSTTRGQIFNAGADPATDMPLTTEISTSAADGSVEVMLVSTNAGPAILTAKAPGLSATFDFEFVAETAHQITLQASPFSIGPNGQQSTVSAVVRDLDGNLVKNRPVNFQLYDVSGGEIFPATNITDSNGLATTVYTSNTVSSSNGVAIGACTDTSGELSNCTNSRDTLDNNNSLDDTYGCTVSGKTCVSDGVAITVAERELFITAGLGNALAEPTPQEYQYDIPVYVTDVNSNPIAGVELSISAVPTHYAKGIWVQQIDAEDDSFIKWISQRSVTCTNEDIDRDGVLDATVNGDGFDEDINGNGVLDPGNIVRTEGNFVTDENGSTMISIVYPQSYAAWVDLDFVVSAKMAGTEHSRTLKITLPVLQDDVTDEKFAPTRHDYGTDNSCLTTD
ncbi:Ig-like domain-containing protein [Psychrosphaera haliotis]|uniref:Ig-like domain-containing protein n=1 Tax=Psychrosphaera haliotis TaxID=555083 RepID=UPI0023716C58|nr:Ig-like domain-containing protein [Psychrosphaera haliotis]